MEESKTQKVEYEEFKGSKLVDFRQKSLPLFKVIGLYPGMKHVHQAITDGRVKVNGVIMQG